MNQGRLRSFFLMIVAIDTVKTRIHVVPVMEFRRKQKPYPWYVLVELLSVHRPLGCRFIAGKQGSVPECEALYRGWLVGLERDGLHYAHLKNLALWVRDGLELWLVTPNGASWVGDCLKIVICDGLERGVFGEPVFEGDHA